MQIVADIYASTTRTDAVTAYTDRRQVGPLIGHVLLIDGLFYFRSDDNDRVFGKGESVSPALKMGNRAAIAARRHYGRDVLVY